MYASAEFPGLSCKTMGVLADYMIMRGGGIYQPVVCVKIGVYIGVGTDGTITGDVENNLLSPL